MFNPPPDLLSHARAACHPSRIQHRKKDCLEDRGYAADTQRAQCAIAPTCGLTHGHGNGRVHHFEEVPVQFMQVLNTRSPSGGMPPGEWERVGDAAEWASSDLNGACADCAMATPIMSSLDEIASGVPPGLLRRVQRAASSLATLGQHRR